MSIDLIALLIFVIVLGCCFFLFRNNGKEIMQYDGSGIITRINQNKKGRTWYYVDISINGKTYSAQTDTYVKTKDVIIGDTVTVKYRYIKGGSIRCYITEDGFLRTIDA